MFTFFVVIISLEYFPFLYKRKLFKRFRKYPPTCIWFLFVKNYYYFKRSILISLIAPRLSEIIVRNRNIYFNSTE